MKVAVIGSGAWGTALALTLVRNGHTVTLWSHDARKAETMCATRKNPALADALLPECLEISAEPACAEGKDMVVFASPSFALRRVSQTVAPFISEGTVLVSVTKGIEAETMLRMSQIVEQETGKRVVVLTGPSHAEEVAKAIPTGCLAACRNKNLAEFVQNAFMSDTFRVYTSPDVVGAELGGALKNVIALCAGICDGMQYGDNAIAMLMTRGLTEIARLGVALGARKDTFAGLAGVGDLIATCTSRHSRNRRAGVLIGQGKTPAEAMEAVGAVVEGYYAARSAYALGQAMGVDMPIVKGAYEVLYEGKDAKEAVHSLLLRSRKPESEDAGWL